MFVFAALSLTLIGLVIVVVVGVWVLGSNFVIRFQKELRAGRVVFNRMWTKFGFHAQEKRKQVHFFLMSAIFFLANDAPIKNEWFPIYSFTHPLSREIDRLIELTQILGLCDNIFIILRSRMTRNAISLTHRKWPTFSTFSLDSLQWKETKHYTHKVMHTTRDRLGVKEVFLFNPKHCAK